MTMEPTPESMETGPEAVNLPPVSPNPAEAVAELPVFSTAPVVSVEPVAPEPVICVMCGEPISVRCESRVQWCARCCPHADCNARYAEAQA